MWKERNFSAITPVRLVTLKEMSGNCQVGLFLSIFDTCKLRNKLGDVKQNACFGSGCTRLVWVFSVVMFPPTVKSVLFAAGTESSRQPCATKTELVGSQITWGGTCHVTPGWHQSRCMTQSYQYLPTFPSILLFYLAVSLSNCRRSWSPRKLDPHPLIDTLLNRYWADFHSRANCLQPATGRMVDCFETLGKEDWGG